MECDQFAGCRRTEEIALLLKGKITQLKRMAHGEESLPCTFARP